MEAPSTCLLLGRQLLELPSHNHGLSRNCTLYQTNLYQLHHQIYSTGTGSALKNTMCIEYGSEAGCNAPKLSLQMFSLSREHHPFSPVSVGGNWHWSPMRIACWHPRAIGTCRMFCSGFFLSQTVEVTRFTAGYWHDMYANTQFEIEFTLPKISMQLMLTIAVKRQGLQFLQLAYTHPRWPLENAPGQVEECCRMFFKDRMMASYQTHGILQTAKSKRRTYSK